MKITISDQPKFDNVISRYINFDDYQYKFFQDFIENVVPKNYTVYSTSFLFYQEDSWIVIIHSDALYIYGNNWTEELLREFSENIDLMEFTDCALVGTSKLIFRLLIFFNIQNYKIIRERLFYESTFLLESALTEFVTIRNGSIDEIDELAVMLQNYYEEEYGGEKNKDIAEMHMRIRSLINNGNIFVLCTENTIASFCTIINPDIGILFTKKEMRLRGFGKHLLLDCSRTLVEKNGIVYLMTDKNSEASNVTVSSLGYNIMYEYSHVVIN